MKIAIIHDWLTVIGGAEKVLKEVLRLYPDADLYSVIDFLKEEDRKEIFGKKAKTTFIQRLPFAKKGYRYYLPLMPYAVEGMNLEQYDLLLSLSSAVAKGVIPLPHQLHICYCHTPMRYAWDLRQEYMKDLDPIKRILASLSLHRLRQWDVISANRVDLFIANSEYVGKRIEKIYRRESQVIHCGVDTDFFALHEHKEDFFLTASRLVPYKKIDLIVRAFSSMPDKQLMVIGEGSEWPKLKKMAPPNVKLLGYQSQASLLSYMQRAKAFIFAAKEDFGIVPLEALSCGTPVIAFAGGGALESLEGVGHFFHTQTAESIVCAVQTFQGREPQELRKRAEHFSLEKFRTTLKRFINRKWYEKHHFGRGEWDKALASFEDILPEAISQARGKRVTSSVYGQKAETDLQKK